MAASFGKLQNHTLEFNEGLNIIQAPNETGKSTWCAFLTAMFYGINSREELIARSDEMQLFADASLAAAASAYIELEKTAFSPIIENILLLGIPSAFSSALRGEWQNPKEKQND